MNICGQNSAVSNMCRRAENALKGHTVSELPNQPSKHSRQLTSSASFLTKVQATTAPNTRCSNNEKKDRDYHLHKKRTITKNKFVPIPQHTDANSALSLNQTFEVPEGPARW